MFVCLTVDLLSFIFMDVVILVVEEKLNLVDDTTSRVFTYIHVLFHPYFKLNVARHG